jgi:hypothetical protein
MPTITKFKTKPRGNDVDYGNPDILWGARRIAEAINRTEKQTRCLIKRGDLDGAVVKHGDGRGRGTQYSASRAALLKLVGGA